MPDYWVLCDALPVHLRLTAASLAEASERVEQLFTVEGTLNVGDEEDGIAYVVRLPISGHAKITTSGQHVAGRARIVPFDDPGPHGWARVGRRPR
ncbi:hypothetical protein [Thalassiella azotivora]